MTKIMKFIPLFSVTLVLIALFQNCGDVSIQQSPSLSPPSDLAQLQSTGQICAAAPESINYNARTIFLVDMSMSNLGILRSVFTDFSYRGPGYDHTIYKSLESQIFGTDLHRERFQVLRSLISAGGGSGSLFSVIGFHDTAVLSGGDSCGSPFYSAPRALDAVDEFDDIQSEIDPNPSTESITEFSRGETNPYLMKGTSYQEALDCLSTKVQSEIIRTSGDQKPSFNVIFITDGATTDTIDSTCDQNCLLRKYSDQLRSLKDELADEQMGFQFHAVFYGSPQSSNPVDCSILPTDSELNNSDISIAAPAHRKKNFCIGVPMLNAMAQSLDPTAQVHTTSDFSSLASHLGQILSVDQKKSFRIQRLSAINLTSLNVKGTLFPDSNMNGLIDEEDSSSTSIRDIFNQFEQRLNQGADPLPSFIRSLRGLNPYAADSNNDRDLDEQSNILEVSFGRDPLSPESIFPTPQQLLVKTSLRQKSMSSCSSGQPEYEFSISQLPLLKGLTSYLDPNPGLLDFSHEADENLIFVYFTSEPLVGGHTKKFLFGAIIRRHYLDKPALQLETADFINLGEVE